MADTIERIPLKEASDHLATLIERVLREGEPVMIETGEGELVALTPVSPARARARTEADWAAFRAAAGSWADVDIEAFLKDIYKSRHSSRPPVDL